MYTFLFRVVVIPCTGSTVTPPAFHCYFLLSWRLLEWPGSTVSMDFKFIQLKNQEKKRLCSLKKNLVYSSIYLIVNRSFKSEIVQGEEMFYRHLKIKIQ